METKLLGIYQLGCLSDSLQARMMVVSDSWWKLVFSVAPDRDRYSIMRRGQAAVDPGQSGPCHGGGAGGRAPDDGAGAPTTACSHNQP